MSTVAIVLLCLGFLFAAVGNIWLIVAAFRQSIVWGLSVLFIPFALLVFLFKHWDPAKQPFLLSVIGSALIVAPIFMNPEAFANQKGFPEYLAQLTHQSTPIPAGDQKPETPLMKQARLEKMQAAFTQHAAELKAKYDTLQAQWAKLPPKDKAARAAFDKEAAAYQAMRKQVETEKADVEALAAATK